MTRAWTLAACRAPERRFLRCQMVTILIAVLYAAWNSAPTLHASGTTTTQTAQGRGASYAVGRRSSYPWWYYILDDTLYVSYPKTVQQIGRRIELQHMRDAHQRVPMLPGCTSTMPIGDGMCGFFSISSNQIKCVLTAAPAVYVCFTLNVRSAFPCGRSDSEITHAR